MSLGHCFYILMLIWLVFGVIVHTGYLGGPYTVVGGNLLLFILFGLLGWQVFGPPLHR